MGGVSGIIKFMDKMGRNPTVEPSLNQFLRMTGLATGQYKIKISEEDQFMAGDAADFNAGLLTCADLKDMQTAFPFDFGSFQVAQDGNGRLFIDDINEEYSTELDDELEFDDMNGKLATVLSST